MHVASDVSHFLTLRMAHAEWKYVLLLIVTAAYSIANVPGDEDPPPLTQEEIEDLKEESKDMFYHAYRAYMENAYPADELMPLSCKGRYKDPLNSRGDLDDTLGNFSLTLIDTVDTLAVLGDLEEFEHAVKLIVQDVSFDHDIVVSVFETNIRVLGGLLSAHILAEYFQQRAGLMPWYKAELLTMAKDLGFRLLPAFNTTTGIPYSRVNLRHGMKTMRISAHSETCTSCAGTMILEMAALSRLTGEPVFEEKAHHAMDELWRMRHRSSDLMGTVLNVHSGDWVRRESGVGAGIDSYYEYCLKAYILLGDDRYLSRFNRHYNAVMKYVSQGPLLIDVHMHRPHTNSKNFMDALLAFWPGLQVLKGDIKPAVATHEMLYQVMQRHNLLPEAFTTDFQVHWAQHPLRPEFVESTYFLYKATNDPYYLHVGKAALKSLQKHARVPCGYATVKDVRTGGHDDRMDSFVLAETFKYLYLLFADPSELVLNLDEFIFTTEAHLLPLTLARSQNETRVPSSHDDMDDLDSEFARCCPNTLNLFPNTVRQPLKNMVDGICPRRAVKRRLYASQFTAGNAEHLRLLKAMGITVLNLADGRVHLLHTAGNARSNYDAEEGLLFMQEMVELSQAQKQHPERPPLNVVFNHRGSEFSITAGRAHFGKDLVSGMRVTARVTVAEPLRACDPLVNPERLAGRIVIIERGDCIFVSKVRKVEEAGGIAAIVVDNTPGSSAVTSSMFAMSGDGNNDVTIPAIFLFYQDASQLLKAISESPGLEVTILDSGRVESSKSAEELLTSDSLLGRLRGSLDGFLGKKESNGANPFRATVERLAGGAEIIRIAHREPKPEGPDSAKRLASDFQEALQGSEVGARLDAEAPPWLLKLYEKLRGDTAKPIDVSQIEAQTEAMVHYLKKKLLTHDGVTELGKYAVAEEKFADLIMTMLSGLPKTGPGWREAHATASIELKALLAKEEELVSAMSNDSDLAGSNAGKSFIKKKEEFVVVLRLLIYKIESQLLEGPPGVDSEDEEVKEKDSIIVVSSDDDDDDDVEVERTTRDDSHAPKDEL